MKTTITSKGQVTVPKSIRDRLGWKRGLVLEVRPNADGRVELVPLDRDPLEELFGSLEHLMEARSGKGAITDDEIRQSLRDRAREKFERIGSEAKR